jgi:hypothetical protein
MKWVANTSNVLARHVRSMHCIEWPDYFVKHELKGQWPTCACGCNEKLMWKKGGFGKYIRGHDNPTIDAPSASLGPPGWIINPFTNREEYLCNEVDVAFLEYCINKNDPVTHDHGIRIGWDDNAGKLHVIVPNFKHIQKKLIIMFDDTKDLNYQLRLKGLKAWCIEHSFILLVMKRDAAEFFVIDAFKPKP